MELVRTPEQDALMSSVRPLAAAVVAPGAAERDREGRFDRSVWQALADNGIVGMPIPEEYGGSGGSILDCAYVNEAVAEVGLPLQTGGTP